MKKGTIINNIKIEKIGYKGVGIGSLIDGKKVIIQTGALPGIVVDCIVVKNYTDYIECKIVEIKEFSNDYKFETNLCQHYFFNLNKDVDENIIGCGGCKWQILSYQDQLNLKQQIVEDSFRFIKDFLPTKGIENILPSSQIYGYRNKLEFSFGNGIKDLNWSLGFHKQGSFSKIININECKLVSSKINEIYNYLKNILQNSSLPVYQQKFHKGFFRHLVIREGLNTGQYLVNISVADNYFNHNYSEKTHWNDLLKKINSDDFLKKNVNTFIVTYNNGLADVIKGRDITMQTLYGEGYIYEKLIFDQNIILNFRISPFSFFQTNTKGAQDLFYLSSELIGKKYGLVLDLYCGAGSIGLSFLKLGIAQKIIGVEINKEGVFDAKFNSKINGLIENSYFIDGKVEDVVFQDKYISSNLSNIGLIIVDPPREGLHKNAIKFLVNIKKINPKIVLLYISCNPVTLASNIKELINNGYKINYLRPVDLFPHTHHMEMISILN